MFIMLSLMPFSLFAQERENPRRSFGLTFPNIGAIWHISDNIAFLPGIDFNHTWSDLSTMDGSITTDTLGVNASMRFYVSRWKGVRLYLAPKYRFVWGKSSNSIPVELYDLNLRTYRHTASGAWGLQYAISDRVSIFGDIGVGYSRLTQSTSSIRPIPTINPRSSQIGTEGTWGLILYLK